MSAIVEQSEKQKSQPKIANRLVTIDQQREFFLWKYKDIDRTVVKDMQKDFERFDIGKKGNLDELEALMLLEYKGTVKTAKELREMIADMDYTKDHMISFLEWCCAIFEKSWEDLNDFVDEDARQRAINDAMVAGEAAKAAEEEIIRAKEAAELAAQERAKKLEEESKLTGVAGMKAFFARQVEDVQDMSKTNEQNIKEEALRRKNLRDAKLKMNEAINLSKSQRRLSAVVRDVDSIAKARAMEEAEKIRKAIEDEKAERAARKAALNAKWSSSASTSEKKG